MSLLRLTILLLIIYLGHCIPLDTSKSDGDFSVGEVDSKTGFDGKRYARHIGGGGIFGGVGVIGGGGFAAPGYASPSLAVVSSVPVVTTVPVVTVIPSYPLYGGYGSGYGGYGTGYGGGLGGFGAGFGVAKFKAKGFGIGFFG